MKISTIKKVQLKFTLNIRDLTLLNTLGMVLAFFIIYGPHYIIPYLINRVNGRSYGYYSYGGEFVLLIGIILAIVIGWKFYKYQKSGKSYEYQVKKVTQIAATLLVTRITMLGAELILPPMDFGIYNIIDIVIQIAIIIFMIVLVHRLKSTKLDENETLELESI